MEDLIGNKELKQDKKANGNSTGNTICNLKKQKCKKAKLKPFPPYGSHGPLANTCLAR